MTKQTVPLAKQSKRAQRAYHKKRRGTWGALTPVTRTVPSGKAYDRRRAKAELNRGVVRARADDSRPVSSFVGGHSMSQTMLTILNSRVRGQAS